MTIITIPPDLVPPEQRPTLERLHQELRIYPWFVQLNKQQNDAQQHNPNPQNKLLLRALSYFQCRNCNTYSQDFFPEDEHYHDGTLVYARCHYCCRRKNSKSTTRTNNNHHHRTKHPPLTTTTTTTTNTTTSTTPTSYMVCILCAASSLSIVSTTTTTMGGITTAGERSIQKFLRVHVGSKLHLKNRNKYNIDASESSYPLLTYPDCRQFGTMPIFKKRFSNNTTTIVKKKNNNNNNNKGNNGGGGDTIHDDDENVKDMNGTSFNSSGMMDGTDSVTSDISESSSGSEEEEEEEEESSEEEEEEESSEEEEEEESMAASSDGDEELNNERDYLHDDDDVTDDDDDEEDSMKEEREQPSSFTTDKAAKESSVPLTTTTSTAASSNCSSGDVDFENIDLLNTEHGQEEGSSSLRRIPVQVREEFVRYKFELLKLYSNTELLSEVERRMQK